MPPSTHAAARLLGVTLRPERRTVALVVGVLVLASLAPLAGPLIISRVVDDALAGRPTADLALLASAYLALALTVEALQLALTWASVRLAWRAGNRLREQLADHVLGLDLAWHGDHPPGELITRVDGDVEALTTFFANVVVKAIGNALLVVGVVVAVAFIEPRIALAIAITAAVTVVLMVRLRAAAVAAHTEERAAAAALYGDNEERLGGLEDLRANGAGPYAVQRMLERSARLWRATRRAFFRGEGAYGLTASAFALGAVLTLAVAIGLNRAGLVTVGAVLATVRYTQMIRQPLERVAEQLPELQKALAGAGRAAALLGETNAVVPPAPGRTLPLPAGALAVELRGATLAYGPGRLGIGDVDLRLEPGERLGLVGRTGSGKTSLGRLLLRLWDPTAGEVRVGGVDLRAVAPADLRRRVAVVTQDVELFRATVRDNLTLFGAVAVADDAVVGVLEEVGLRRWLDALPRGLDTMVGAGATAGLSAGEGQLLAFARALLRDPGLVVLDEASSRLDPATETRLAVVTERLLEGRTAVVVAHRLATLDRVDVVAVVEAGRVVELGRRRDLAADPASRFARLLAAGDAVLPDEPVTA